MFLVRATPEVAFSAKGSLLLYLILSQSKSSRDTFANGPAYFVCEMTHLATNGSRSGWQPYRFSKGKVHEIPDYGCFILLTSRTTAFRYLFESKPQGHHRHVCHASNSNPTQRRTQHHKFNGPVKGLRGDRRVERPERNKVR